MSHETNTTCPCRSREPGFATGYETGAETPENRHQPRWSRAENWRKLIARTLQKNIRVTPEQWDRIENAARARDVSANRLVVELAMETLDRREWPHS